MINDSEIGLFNFVIVHKLDRFSRDRYDSIFYKKKLKDNDVRVISVTEQFNDSPESIILEGLLESMSEYYSKKLAREVMKGLEENARQCKHTGGKPPFGFDVDSDKKYVVNTHEAIAVKKIFDMFINDFTYKEMCTYLHDYGYKTKYNKPFSQTTINGMLKNIKYIGTYTYKLKKQTKVNGSRVDIEHSKEDMIIIENGIPAIIDKEVFELTQKKLSTRKVRTKSFNAKNTYLLTGRLQCGCCGGSMGGYSRSINKKAQQWITYYCNTRKKDKTACHKKEINRDKIEYTVLKHLEEHIFTDKFINDLATKIYNYNNFTRNDKGKL